jgi:hypothetical protein
MKKLFTLLFIALGTMSANAQLQFVDKDGNVVPDGTTLNIEAVAMDDGFGGILIEANSGLSVKNTSDKTVGTSVDWQVEQLDNGAVQVCFPEACVSHNATGLYHTDKGTLEANETRALNSEWYPDTYGQAKVKYTLLAYDYSTLGYNNVRDIAIVYINYTYTDPAAAIESHNAERRTVKDIYSLNGTRTAQTHRGVNIVRMSDGSVRKVLSK